MHRSPAALPAAPPETATDSYAPPAVTVLGHVAELTQLGSGQMSELEMDGSQA
jgi:hypothetical protein